MQNACPLELDGGGKMQRIHICDTVTVNDGNCPKDRFMWIVGRLKMNESWPDEFEGMWEVQEINGDGKRYQTFGRFITVWKPIRPPAKTAEGQALRITAPCGSEEHNKVTSA
jgi:hypothetical protein